MTIRHYHPTHCLPFVHRLHSLIHATTATVLQLPPPLPHILASPIPTLPP